MNKSTIESSEVCFATSASFVGKVLCDGHVSMDFIQHLPQCGA